MRSKDPLWIMVDVETSGPIFGVHSLLEIGAVVGARPTGVESSFASLLKPTSDAGEQSRSTFDRAQAEGDDPASVMRRFAEWTKPYLARGARFIARPAAFDWPWIVFYAWRYLGENPFGFRAVCASSWFEAKGKRFQVTLPHVAVDDARIQLEHFFELG